MLHEGRGTMQESRILFPFIDEGWLNGLHYMYLEVIREVIMF